MKQKIGKYFLIACVLFIAYALFGAMIKVAVLKANGKCIKAVLIPEMTSFTHRYTKAYLVYQFTYEGKTYSGNSLEKDTSKVGDSVCVVYLPTFPGVNRPVRYFDSGEVKCSCEK